MTEPAPVPETQRYTRAGIAAIIGAMVLAAAILFAMGRTAFGSDGFGFWVWDIWSSHNSQRVLDPYSFSHIIHGFLFFGILWLVARRLPVQWRLLIAVVLEAGWEILENSPIIINRYRATTISLGYTGDSVMNSLSDILMMSTGFLVASKIRVWQSVTAVLAMEIGCLILFRDNFTLNVIMLTVPIEAIKTWQLGGRPSS